MPAAIDLVQCRASVQSAVVSVAQDSFATLRAAPPAAGRRRVLRPRNGRHLRLFWPAADGAAGCAKRSRSGVPPKLVPVAVHPGVDRCAPRACPSCPTVCLPISSCRPCSASTAVAAARTRVGGSHRSPGCSREWRRNRCPGRSWVVLRWGRYGSVARPAGCRAR
ncbi:hypothetical protein D3C78_948060 [compost metagenome]